MAIWQYNFTVVPKSTFARGDVSLKDYLDEDGFLDDESYWLIEPIKTDFFDEIGQILRKKTSWSTDIILFGNQESNRFEVYKNENDIVISVSFRVDYTSEYEDILRAIISFVEMHDLAILDEKMKLLDNNFVAIKSHIENSEQCIVYEKLSNKKD